MLGGNDIGTEDMFEEVPAILVVIVATFVFLMSIAEGFISYSERKEEDRLDQGLEEFSSSILTFEPLLCGTDLGRFCSHKLDDHARQKLQYSFPPDALGFHYNISITDIGLYEEKYDWSAGEELREKEVTRTTSMPVIISNAFGQHHPAMMRVTIWES